MSREAGLTPTSTEVLGASAAVDADQSPGEFWHTIASSEQFQRILIESVREILAGTHYAAREEPLRDAGMTAVDGTLAGVVKALDLAPEHPRHQQALETIARIGNDKTIIGNVGFEAIVDGPIALLEATDHLETIAVRVDAGFRDRRRDHRERVCQLIGTLATVCDVRVVAPRLTQRWLAREHREDLPGVSEWCNEGRDESPLAARIDEATDALDPDGRKVAILRQLSDEPAETLSRHQIQSMHDISRTRLSQIFQTDDDSLTDLGLVDVFGPDGSQKVELLKAGRKALAAFDAEIGRQAELVDSVSGSPNSHNRPCNPAHGMGGEDGEPYQTVYMDRHDHAAAAACGLAGGVTLADGPFNHAETADTDRVRYVSYDPDRDEAIVAVRATGALQHTVSVATALADPMLIDDALPLDRLESITLSEAVLRDARCIGALSDEALEDPETLRDALVEWGNDLEDLTTDLKRRNYDDRDEFRSAIMRSAHGLAGSIVHLLDVVGVDVVREVRVPAGLNDNRLTGLTESITKAAAIQSRYGHYAAYRQLFEPRSEKRQQALDVPIDAEDPFGSLIGGIVVRGPGVDRLRPHLEARFGSDEDLIEDAPEFAINVTLREVTREDFATAASRILSPKNLSLTRETMSLIHALAASPHAAARALQQLGKEDWPRDLRPDEVRFLATLDSRHILPEFAPSVGKIVLALLEATESISQTELADRAGVSTQTIRNHRETLEALGLLEVADQAYRLAISTTEERDETFVPDLVTAESILEAADALLEGYLTPKRYGDPEDPLGGVLFDFPDDPHRPWSLVDHDDLGPWLELGARLAGVDRPEETIVKMGPEIEQQPLPTSDTRTEVTG